MVSTAVFHNIVWSRYKGAVFSKLHDLSSSGSLRFTFCQIAETDGERTTLGGLDLRYHAYPFSVLFAGSYSDIRTSQLVQRLFAEVWYCDAELILLPGYHRAEYWAMLLASVLRGKRRAVFCDSTIYDQPQHLLKGWLKRIFFSFCDGYFAYGERAAAYLRHYGADSDRIFHRRQAAALPLGYSEAAALRDRLEATSNKARFLYVGRLSPEKSLRTALEAFECVREQMPDARLVLAGAGPQLDELQAEVAVRGLAESVDFLGSLDIDALAHEYARATCLVLPSTSEPWGLVVNEALSFGCPVVVSHRCGCVPELVEGKASGLVFEAGSASDLAEKLVLAAQKFADAEATARAALDLIRPFSPEAAAQAILDGCNKMLRQR